MLGICNLRLGHWDVKALAWTPTELKRIEHDMTLLDICINKSLTETLKFIAKTNHKIGTKISYILLLKSSDSITPSHAHVL